MPFAATVSCPALSLEISNEECALVLKCRGKVILESSDFLKSEVKSRIPENGRLVLDFTDVSRMDSAGLGSIVSLYLTAKTKNSELELVNFSQPIRKLFAITNLLSIFEKNKQQ